MQQLFLMFGLKHTDALDGISRPWVVNSARAKLMISTAGATLRSFLQLIPTVMEEPLS
jgi:hypothetical protein